MAKVSVIVPIYNVEKYISKCLDSLDNQTLKDIQIILVNDGSKDSSGKIAEEYSKKNPNKFIYVKKQNGGLSSARNYGLRYATGEYLCFLDSDDYIEPNTYEVMYEKAILENSDYVECDFIWEYANKSKLDIRVLYSNKKEMLQNVRVVAWNKLIKREIIEKNNITFPEGLRYEDVEFTYKLIPYLNNMSYVDMPLIHYVQRNNSIARMQNEKTAEIFCVLDRVIEYYKKNNIYEEYFKELEYNYARILLCSSLKRMCLIKDKTKRKELLNKNWEKLNKQFPRWKKNSIIKNGKNNKCRYLRSVNKYTYKFYCFLLSFNFQKI